MYSASRTSSDAWSSRAPGKPRSFGRVVKNAKQVVVYSRSDCGGPYKGTIETVGNDQITLAWVDAEGVVGKQSASIKVQEAKANGKGW